MVAYGEMLEQPCAHNVGSSLGKYSSFFLTFGGLLVGIEIVNVLAGPY